MRLSSLSDLPCVVKTADLSVDDLACLFEGTDAVVHCAARAAPWGKRDLFWADNVSSTERLLQAARLAGSVRRFVHLSSPSIYFRRRDQLNIPESFEPPQRWYGAYAETKWICEERVRAEPVLGPIILRPRAVFGARDAAIVPRIAAVARSGIFPLPGGGTAWTDVTYVENVVSAVERALACERRLEGRAFNISNGEPIQVRDLIRRLLKSLNLRARLITMPRGVTMALAALCEQAARLRRTQREPRLTSYGVGLLAYSQTLSIAAARKDLGYEPAISIDEGLDRYARWLKAQG